MVATARSFALEDTFLEPQVLDPPPTRHALFILLLVLAAVIHIGTTGWGDLYDGPESQFAGGAKEMLATQHWLVPTNNGTPVLQTPPMVYWLIILSYKIFGVTAIAARVPIAIAMIASIALTFLIGERLAGYWRGFAAGLIHLCFGGAFVLGRAVTAEPVFGALIAGALFCALCGYQRRKFRRIWFSGFWFCAGLACLSKGMGAFVYLAAICVLLAILFREARLRFRFLLHWSYLVLFLAVVAPWFIWAQRHFPGHFLRALDWLGDPGLSRWQFLLLHLAWWFPTSILVLPGLFFATRKIVRPSEFTFIEALPFCWMAVGFLPLVLLGPPSVYSSMSMWGAFALWSALVWDRTPPNLRVAGLGAVLIVAVAIAASSFFRSKIPTVITLTNDPSSDWPTLQPLLQIAGVTLGIFTLLALYFAIRQRSEIALLLALVAMVPVGLCLAEGGARMAPTFSLAGAARFLNARLGERSLILYEGPLREASTLTFYLNQKFSLVNRPQNSRDKIAAVEEAYLDENSVLEAWNGSDPVYLITDENRVPHWQELIVARVHIFHQVTSCGHYAVLSNQL